MSKTVELLITQSWPTEDVMSCSTTLNSINFTWWWSTVDDDDEDDDQQSWWDIEYLHSYPKNICYFKRKANEYLKVMNNTQKTDFILKVKRIKRKKKLIFDEKK